MTTADVEPIIERFSGVFLGGTDRFKSGAAKWCQFAHRHNKKFHYGRCGVPRKIRHAVDIGADSCDSAFFLWDTSRINEVVMVLTVPERQLKLWG